MAPPEFGTSSRVSRSLSIFSDRWKGVFIMQKVTPCLWFDGQAEQAARYYVSLLPDSRIDRVLRSLADTPSGPAGTVLLVEFTLAGNRFTGLNGGPQFPFTEAVSFQQAQHHRVGAHSRRRLVPVQPGWAMQKLGQVRKATTQVNWR
jgi:3-demethylubiquinone-9 3-methyltransferase